MDTNETKIFYTLIAGLIILALLMLFFLFTIFAYWKKRSVLQSKNFTHYFNLLETEKQRIAIDLHDDIGASLAAVKLLLEYLEEPDEETAAIVRKSEKIIDELMIKVRRFSYNMMPMLLKNKGLNEALKDLVESMTYPAGIKVTYNYNAIIYNEEKSIHLYRIVQEAIHNLVKHSKATAFYLEVQRKENKIRLLMQDNGIGFNRKNVDKQKGLGLRSISARAELLEAEIYLSTEPGKGVEFLIEIPDNVPKYKSNYC